MSNKVTLIYEGASIDKCTFDEFKSYVLDIIK